MEEHEGQEPDRLGLVGHQGNENVSKPDRLRAQLSPDQGVARGGVVALVEHEIEDAQDAVEPLREEVVGRNAIRDPRVADLPPGTDETLGKGRLRDEERPGDLRCRQSAERPQGEGHLASIGGPDDST
jgi:hypothetical protein